MREIYPGRAVRALEERRWLTRRESEQDRREESLSLTAPGLQAYGEIVPRALAFEAGILAALGPHAEPLLRALALMEERFPVD